MRLAQLERPSFSGHETFPFRYTWLKKAYDGVLNDPHLFGAEDALVRLGVGKNMVRSIRHWSLTCGTLVEPSEARDRRRGELVPSELGERLLSTNGWDPYLEDPATLWLLHWQVASTPHRSSTWYFVFNELGETHFTRPMLIDRLVHLATQRGWPKVSPASLKRDVDTFVRSYVPSARTKAIEDTLDCPLVELQLIREDAEVGTYVLSRGRKPTLPDEIFAFSAAEFLLRSASQQNTVSLEELQYAEGSPGRTFLLDARDVAARCENFEDLTGGAWTFDTTAGLAQVLVHRRIDPLSLLRRHYEPTRGRRGGE